MRVDKGLVIRLTVTNDRVSLVEIHSGRPVNAARVLQGKSVDEVMQIVPILFSICSTAQAQAASLACGRALGIHCVPYLARVRDCLVDMETIREHVWRVAMDWPSYIGEEAETSTMREILALQKSYRQQITAGRDPFKLDAKMPDMDVHKLSATVRSIAQMLERDIFARPASEWLSIADEQSLQDWAATAKTAAARLLCYVSRKQWMDSGNCSIQALPWLTEDQLSRIRFNDDLMNTPEWLGECRETSVLTRVDNRLLRALRSQHGNGLLVRLVARLIEVAMLSAKLIPEAEPADPQEMIENYKDCNPACVQVWAARGILLHRVRLEGDRVASYQTVAPTEWNFHPQGVVANSLAALRGERQAIEQQAHLLINSIDPCVDYQLKIVS